MPFFVAIYLIRRKEALWKENYYQNLNDFDLFLDVCNRTCKRPSVYSVSEEFEMNKSSTLL